MAGVVHSAVMLEDKIAAAPDLLPPPLLTAHGRSDDRHSFLRVLFDRTAGEYDRIERMMSLGSGSWYRRTALQRAGVKPGMTVLDVAVGTGLVARQAVRLVGSPRRVIGLDPSGGMLARTGRALPIPLVMGAGERLPLRVGTFDVVSLGYALRHLTDLVSTFRDFRRVLRPNGILCMLEITRPRGRAGRLLLRRYLHGIVPWLARMTSHRAESRFLWRYYWLTIERAVPAEDVLNALWTAGFAEVRRHVVLGVFSEYTARKPARR